MQVGSNECAIGLAEDVLSVAHAYSIVLTIVQAGEHSHAVQSYARLVGAAIQSKLCHLYAIGQQVHLDWSR